MSVSPLLKALLSLFFIFLTGNAFAQTVNSDTLIITDSLFGIASYYGKGFHGRQTASGEIFDENGMTAACNVLPLGTWIRVTNMKNDKTVVVKVNDRMHPKNKRLVDMSKGSAGKLEYVQYGLARVRVDVLGPSVADSLKQ